MKVISINSMCCEPVTGSTQAA